MKIARNRNVSADIDPANFARPLSPAYSAGKMWRHELPESIRLSLVGLRAMNRILEPKEITAISRDVLGFCDFAAGSHVLPANAHKQIGGLFTHHGEMLHRGFGQRTHGRLYWQKKPIPISHLQPHRSKSGVILRELESMLNDEDEPDFVHRPTQYAYDRARALIEASYSRQVGSPPTPAIAPDGAGGLIVEWKSGPRVVRLIVGANENSKSYVYKRTADESAIDHSAQGSTLATRLRSVFVS